jgi:fatty acid desaturase
VGLLVAGRQYLGLGVLTLLGTFLVVEAVFRRQLTALITRLTVVLAVVAALILLYTFFWQIVVVAAVAAGVYLLWENLSELRG